MKALIGLIVLLLSAVSASAQTHPCDQTPPANPNVASPVKVGFCYPQASASQITSFKVYLDGSTTPIFSGPLTAIGTASASGQLYFETLSLAVTQGSHSVQASAVSAAGEGPKTTAIPFVVIGLPVAPSNPRVIWP